MPSVRDLCSSLSISLATLSTALRALEAKGMVIRRHGSGIYVTERVAIAHVAIVASATQFLAGGSPVWGLLVGELLKGFRAKGFETSFYLAQPADDSAKTLSLPPEFLLAVEQGRVDGVAVIGLDDGAVSKILSYGLQPVSFAGPGAVNCRIDVVGLAGELAEAFIREGNKTAMVVGCHHENMWEAIKVEIESAGLEVMPGDEGIWADQGLTQRMSTPYMHVGQEFAARFEALVESGKAPDVLYIMDDIFAHGFLMLWSNSPLRGKVALACLANKELHMFAGWGMRLGLMEVGVGSFTHAMVEVVAESLANPDSGPKGWVEAVAARLSEEVTGIVEEAPGTYTLALQGRAYFVGTPKPEVGVS